MNSGMGANQQPPLAEQIDESQVMYEAAMHNSVEAVPVYQDHNAQQEQIRRDEQMAFSLARMPQTPPGSPPPRKDSSVSILEADTEKPYMIYILIVVNTIVLVAELVVNNMREGVFIVAFSVNPTIGPSQETLITMGAKVGERILVYGEWWRLITPVFLHAGVIHLLANMLFLWFFGRPLERAFGACKIGYIFLMSGLFGMVLSAIFLPDTPTVGASGACYGLIGATWADFFLNCSYYRGDKVRTFVQLGVGTVLNLALGLLPYLDNFAHIGGFVMGFASGMSVLTRRRFNWRREEKPEMVYQIVCSLTCNLLAPLMIIGLVVLLFVQVDELEDCDWCSYLSCIPTPWWSCELDCSTEYTFETVQSGPDAGNLLLTCPAGLGTVLLTPPFPTLDTVSQQVAACNEFCFDL